jgi:hypothetical protein
MIRPPFCPIINLSGGPTRAIDDATPRHSTFNFQLATAIFILPVSLRSGFSSMKSQLSGEKPLGNRLKRSE